MILSSNYNNVNKTQFYELTDNTSNKNMLSELSFKLLSDNNQLFFVNEFLSSSITITSDDVSLSL